MTITQQHYEQAAQLLVEQQPDATTHSEPYWEGYLDAVAWCVAGQPPTHGSDRPYMLGTMQRDAWAYGWLHGQAFAEKQANTSAF
nr:hypothetical protein [uncultured Halomonas sp.]